MILIMKRLISEIVKLKQAYCKGKIEKAAYIIKMHNQHKILFDYADFITSTDIAKIEISSSRVVMTEKHTNLKYICDKDDQRIAPLEILNFDNYEKTELNMILRLIKNKCNFFDIGANIGWYSLILAKLVKNINIYAFEPITKTFNYLKQNIRLNNIKDIKIYNFGFSDQEEQKVFYYYPQESGNASLANVSKRPHIQKVIGQVKKLDDFAKRQKVKIDFIKCDVEGAEFFVFKGGKKTIAEDRPIIISEILRKWSAGFNYQPNAIIHLLRDIGYNCYVIKDKNLAEIKTVNEQTMETNFVFLHGKKHDKIIKKLSL